MSTSLILLIAAATVLLGLLIGIVVMDARVIDKQRRTIEILKRAERRQAAAAEIARADLLAIQRDAQIITLWRTQTHERRTT